MEERSKELSELKNYITKVDNDISMVLQSIQWDQKKVMQGNDMVVCSFDIHHRIPASSKVKHEKECMLKRLGYSKEDIFLPEPAYPESKTCLTFCKDKIQEIINNASKLDPLFKKGVRSRSPEPLTHSRLQCTYTADERRSLYDAVIATVPTEVTELDPVMPSGSEDLQACSKQTSKMELMAQQRDLKRRSVKYRVATKSKNYSQVLHEVIRNQMEMYSETRQGNSNESNKETDVIETKQLNNKLIKSEPTSDTERRHKSDNYMNKNNYYKHDNYNQYDHYKNKNKQEKYYYDDKYEKSSSKAFERYQSRREGQSNDSRKETEKKIYKDLEPSDRYKDEHSKHKCYDKQKEYKYRDKPEKPSRYSSRKDVYNTEDYRGDKRKSEDKYNKRYSREYPDEEEYDRKKKHKYSKEDKHRKSGKSYRELDERDAEGSRRKT